MDCLNHGGTGPAGLRAPSPAVRWAAAGPPAAGRAIGARARRRWASERRPRPRPEGQRDAVGAQERFCAGRSCAAQRSRPLLATPLEGDLSQDTHPDGDGPPCAASCPPFRRRETARSHVHSEPRSGAPRHAQQHRPILGVFLIGERVVAVFGTIRPGPASRTCRTLPGGNCSRRVRPCGPERRGSTKSRVLRFPPVRFPAGPADLSARDGGLPHRTGPPHRTPGARRSGDPVSCTTRCAAGSSVPVRVVAG